jgi:hypothetical protein
MCRNVIQARSILDTAAFPDNLGAANFGLYLEFVFTIYLLVMSESSHVEVDRPAKNQNMTHPNA